MHAERKRGRSRTRVLYWFRTPPGVKVGRVALDDDAIRRIEQQNPDLEFDWPKILKGAGTPATEARPPFEARRQDRGNSKSRFPKPASTPASTPQQPQQRPIEDKREPEPTPPPALLAPPPPPLEDLPAEGTPAHEKIGQEGVQRLRQRYADVRARIFERCQDQARRDELMASADRINPDAWKSVDEVVSGLEQYEAVLASLREVVGRKRRRRKRGGGRRQEAGAAIPGESAAEPTENGGPSADGDEDSGPDDDPGDFSS
jgi:hypothetical protein